MENDFIERLNGRFRRGVLDMRVFRNLREVREQAEQWLADYNTEIPHASLGGLTPAEFVQYRACVDFCVSEIQVTAEEVVPQT